MASIPGGGAEILTDRMRKLRSPGKVGADDWVDCMRVAHEEGLRTTATMVLGLGETFGDCVEHMKRVRDLQDQTSGFTAFIAWTFETDDTPLEHEIGKDRISGYGAGAVAYLRMLAVSRLYLDNIDNMQSSWVTQGPEIGQIALLFGANDLGSTMLEENVVSAAGTVYCMDSDEMRRLAEDMGMQAVRRNFFYDA
ncbi:MAG: dehypoxanthine futalosine cyclase, partial [Bacteroidetes bacterium]